MPAWLPVANIFSVGDVLIGIGAAIAIVAAMHGRGPLATARPPNRRRRTGLTARPRCVRALTRAADAARYYRCMARPGPVPAPFVTKRCSLRVDHRPGQTRRETGTQSQGSSLGKTARLPVAIAGTRNHRGGVVKANLARFTVAVSLLATMALTLGAGLKWH